MFQVKACLAVFDTGFSSVGPIRPGVANSEKREESRWAGLIVALQGAVAGSVNTIIS